MKKKLILWMAPSQIQTPANILHGISRTKTLTSRTATGSSKSVSKETTGRCTRLKTALFIWKMGICRKDYKVKKSCKMEIWFKLYRKISINLGTILSKARTTLPLCTAKIKFKNPHALKTIIFIVKNLK